MVVGKTFIRGFLVGKNSVFLTLFSSTIPGRRVGNPVDFILTGGEVHDSQYAEALLKDKHADFVIADKAYDTNAILSKIAQIGATAVTPPESNRKEQRKFDKSYYKDHNLIE